jgi:hypothetical protein
VATKKKEVEIDILKITRERWTVCVLGTTPLYNNRLSDKVKRELLLPSVKKNNAARAATLKHDPMAEFRDSPYMLLREGDTAPTLIAHLAAAFKAGIAGAARDIPGTSRAQIDRLLTVEGNRIPIYGIPHLAMDPVRSADMNRTPDIRTRCVLPEWCCRITVSFQTPLLKQSVVSMLLGMAGQTQGIGDWRNEKGSGNFGSYEIVDEDNADFQRIMATGGRAVQLAAMKNPAFFGEDTEEHYSWYTEEVKRRDLESMLRVDDRFFDSAE